MKRDERELTALFKRLGAPQPAEWAKSQLKEDIPQLGRFLFLRQAWRQLIDEDDPSWIDASIRAAHLAPDAPLSGVGHALIGLRAKGASDEELTDLARGMQAELLASICYLLSDPGDLELEVADVAWALVQVDGDGQIVGQLDALHESVLETDPTGREMRPRAVPG